MPRIAIFSGTIFEMFVENGRKTGFWATRDSWSNSCAQITFVGPTGGKAPYFGNPEMRGVLYRFTHCEVLRDPYEHFSPGRGGWYWIQPPDWSGEPHIDPFAHRLELHVAFSRNKEAKKLGATWSDTFRKFWIDERDLEKVQILRAAGFFEPLPPPVHYIVHPSRKDEFKALGGRWDDRVKRWYLAGDRFKEIPLADAAGFIRINPSIIESLGGTKRS